jgi:hypothetical protein
VAFTTLTTATLGVSITGAGQKSLQVLAFSNDMIPADPPIPDSFNISFNRVFLVSTVTVAPANTSTSPNGMVGLTATVGGLPSTEVTWSATGGSLAPSGNTAQWTAPSTPGTYTVTATSVANSAFRGRSTITVSGTPPCTVGAIAQRFGGLWQLTASNVVASSGDQNCSTVPEFVAFQNGGTLTITGGGPGGSLGLSNGLQGYSGEFWCNGVGGGFTSGNENFNLDYDFPDPPASEKIKGQLTLRIQGSGILPCILLMEAER